ncbi:hypothetical protein [Streptomyces sp. BK340]|nr:hypothetical protein [Streptomyces sp. BK340]
MATHRRTIDRIAVPGTADRRSEAPAAPPHRRLRWGDPPPTAGLPAAVG